MKIINEFKPDAVIGTGDMSGPVVFSAALKESHHNSYEQNAFPGVTKQNFGQVCGRSCHKF